MPKPQVFPLMVPRATTSAADREVVSPYDGHALGTMGIADGAAVQQALATASALFQDRDRWMTAAQRIEILGRAAEIMKDRADDLALGAAAEGGKPLIDSRIEVARAIDCMHICIETLRTESGKTVPMNVNAASQGRLAFTRPEPIGVVVAVSAFNHPLNLIAHQVGPAVAVGCPVIVKPAEVTPLSCLRFVGILREAGLPDEWCQAVVTENRDVSEALVTDERVAMFSFIGSAKVGWYLRSKVAPGTRCALEHGGAAPVILAADADLGEATASILKGGFYHAGQVCVSVQRVFAHETIARGFAKDLAARAAKLRVGDPAAEDTEVGPLIRPREVTRVGEWVDEARGAGADILCGGEAISETCYAPTVVYQPPAGTRLASEEVFGPVVCVAPYRDIDEAVARANAIPYSFQAAVFTRDLDTALRAYARLNASAVMVNDHTAFRVDWMPFAGLGQSGLAVGGIPYTMHDMQIEKMMVLRSAEL